MRAVSLSVLIAVPVLIVGLVIVAVSLSDRTSAATAAASSQPTGTAATASSTISLATSAGASDAITSASAQPSATTPPPAAPAAVDQDLVGSTPAIPGDLNANLRSVVEAVRTASHPERLTPMIAPAPYDHQRFLANPQAYLDVIEPGRVYQSAEPGMQVPQLELVGDAVATIQQGGRTTLRVRTVPLAPTTFTSFECGAFDNHLTSMTVQADAEGIASAVFTAPPGTLNDVTILAGSPLASGQVNFCVTVKPAGAHRAAAIL